ncbi:MAG: hypothetical protein COX20_03135 [Desulfobacterales bacterium CG23_combo_of_CG06-09_8_20_14_all_52_9]|nr:MAG: hypothetical protein COX20_03135 [Desulfobacterales bacterium CG23_combo_of_CG06-09_8_20_14_all_52_9]
MNRMISKCSLPGLPVEEGEPRRSKKSLRNYRGGQLKRDCQRKCQKMCRPWSAETAFTEQKEFLTIKKEK